MKNQFIMQKNLPKTNFGRPLLQKKNKKRSFCLLLSDATKDDVVNSSNITCIYRSVTVHVARS